MAPSPENDFPESDRTADNMFFVEKQAEIVQQIQDLAAEERYKILQRIMEKQSSQLKEDIDKKFEEMDEMIAKKGSLVEASKFGKDLFGYVWPYATFNKKIGRLLEGTLNTHVQAYMLAEVKDLAVEERQFEAREAVITIVQANSQRIEGLGLGRAMEDKRFGYLVNECSRFSSNADVLKLVVQTQARTPAGIQLDLLQSLDSRGGTVEEKMERLADRDFEEFKALEEQIFIGKWLLDFFTKHGGKRDSTTMEEHRVIVDELVVAKEKLESAMDCMLASFGYHALRLLKGEFVEGLNLLREITKGEMQTADAYDGDIQKM